MTDPKSVPQQPNSGESTNNPEVARQTPSAPKENKPATPADIKQPSKS